MQILRNGQLVTLTSAQQTAWEAERSLTPVPVSVKRYQALLALLEYGGTPITKDQVYAAIDQIADPLEREKSKVLFDAPDWLRNDPRIIALGESFGFSPQQIDDLFRLAATLP